MAEINPVYRQVGPPEPDFTLIREEELWRLRRIEAEAAQPKSTELDEFQQQIGAWGRTVFGEPDVNGIMAHLREEVDELSQAVNLDALDSEVMEEAADCLILLCQLAYCAGYSLMDAATTKHVTNTQRHWGHPDAAGVVRHVEVTNG